MQAALPTVLYVDFFETICIESININSSVKALLFLLFFHRRIFSLSRECFFPMALKYSELTSVLPSECPWRHAEVQVGSCWKWFKCRGIAELTIWNKGLTCHYDPNSVPNEVSEANSAKGSFQALPSFP